MFDSGELLFRKIFKDVVNKCWFRIKYLCLDIKGSYSPPNIKENHLLHVLLVLKTTVFDCVNVPAHSKNEYNIYF